MPSWLKLTPIVAIAASVSLLVGCATMQADSNQPTEQYSITAQASNQNMSELAKLEGTATVEMTINGKPVTIELDGKNAPITAGNFVELVNSGFYNGLKFHRVVKDPGQPPFVAQGGDPQGTGMGGFVDPTTKRSRYIPLEITPEGADTPVYSKTLPQAGINKPPALRHTRGAVAMARSQMPDSASSQFYFALSDLSFLDGNYAVFGYVKEGMDAVDSIKQGDKIESAKVVSGLENLKKP
ncbi:peptidylprolyl isomerase [Oscillatoria sp. FACHB-1406]|nr:peptidylprolyl isomerase [Oscillatoria sp. FACHB-1406]